MFVHLVQLGIQLVGNTEDIIDIYYDFTNDWTETGKLFLVSVHKE